MRIYTIGFTKKSAEAFFGLLSDSGAKRVVDVRLSNHSQLAGFAKQDDLTWFLKRLCNMDYVHRVDLAPTDELFRAYRKEHGSWEALRDGFLELLRQRRIEETIPQEIIADSVLLCSEETPEHCHRRLVAEYLRDHWDNVEIIHLV